MKKVRGTSKHGLVNSSLVFGILTTLFFLSMECDCFALLSTSINRKRSRGVLNKSNNIKFSSTANDFDDNNQNDNDNVCNGGDDDAKPTKKSLLELLSPSNSCSVNQMSGTDLAYIGDVVFELFVRSRHVWPSKRTSDLQNLVVGSVRAEYQSILFRKLKETFPLSAKEKQVMMRGRNAVRSKNRRNPSAYQDATSLEALIGYVYITEPNRCQELLAWLETVIDEI
mmetsp:Transcript_57070/g.64652  ORF Transcript_57070/g.64652 Transcript_57070/m.64652 type:complete len:226 (+) Transcript_57070:52-729(+)